MQKRNILASHPAFQAQYFRIWSLPETETERKCQALRLIIDEKTSHEKALQEQVDYLTKKLFGP